MYPSAARAAIETVSIRSISQAGTAHGESTKLMIRDRPTSKPSAAPQPIRATESFGSRGTCALTVKLRGRLRRQAALKLNEARRAVPKRPDRRRGRTLSPSARGAKQTTHHGPLQRLLERTGDLPTYGLRPVRLRIGSVTTFQQTTAMIAPPAEQTSASRASERAPRAWSW